MRGIELQSPRAVIGWNCGGAYVKTEPRAFLPCPLLREVELFVRCAKVVHTRKRK